MLFKFKVELYFIYIYFLYFSVNCCYRCREQKLKKWTVPPCRLMEHGARATWREFGGLNRVGALWRGKHLCVSIYHSSAGPIRVSGDAISLAPQRKRASIWVGPPDKMIPLNAPSARAPYLDLDINLTPSKFAHWRAQKEPKLDCLYLVSQFTE